MSKTPEQIEDQLTEANIMEALLDEYEDPIERENAKRQLMEEMGVDPDTKLATDGSDETPEAKADEETEEPEVKADEVPETGEEVKASDEEGKEEKVEDDAEMEKLKAQMSEQARLIAELQGKLSVNDADSQIRAQVDSELKEQRDSLEESKQVHAEKLAKFKEDYGEEAANELDKEAKAAIESREKLLDKEWQDKYAMLKAEKVGETQTQTALVSDIHAVPELKQWHDDAMAYRAGDTSKNPSRFEMAGSIDNYLKTLPEWTDRPRAERFAEAVNRVKAAVGEQSGSPKAEDPAEVKRKLAEEIKRQAQGKAADIPNSLSDLPGVGAGGELTLERLNDMAPADLLSMNLSMNQLEQLALRIPE